MHVIPDQLSEFVYIGAKEAAANLQTLQSLGIKNILVCCTTLPFYHPTEIRYLRLCMNDSLDQNLNLYLPYAIKFINDAMSK